MKQKIRFSKPERVYTYEEVLEETDKHVEMLKI